MRRALLTAGVFFCPATWLVYIALIVVILAALMQPWLLLMGNRSVKSACR